MGIELATVFSLRILAYYREVASRASAQAPSGAHTFARTPPLPTVLRTLT